MKIKPEVSSSSSDYTYGSPPTTVPIVSTTQAETSVRVKDGTTIIIAGLIKDDKIVWPDGYTMNVSGLAEALECSRDQEVAPDLTLPVVTIPGLVLMKVVAYMDRPEERARDVVDMLYCFERYEATGESSRRFDCTGTQIDGEEITFELAGAFLVGMDVAVLAKPNSLKVLQKFIAGIPDEFARPVSQILSEEKRYVDTEKRRAMLYRLFRVFSAGVNQTG